MLSDPALADAPVGAADADVLVGAAEASHGMALEMGQGKETVVIRHVRAVGHLLHPFAALNGQGDGALLVHDIHRAEIPAVDLESFAVLLGGIAAALIVSVGLHDDRVVKLLLGGEQFLHPRAWDDVGAVGLAGVELDGDLSSQIGAHLLKGLLQAFGREIAREVYDGFVSAALLIGNVGSAGQIGLRHGFSS